MKVVSAIVILESPARMEQYGEAGKINISGGSYELVKDHFTRAHRSRNKGDVGMYFVEG